MANEIQASSDSGGVLYALVRNAAGQVWRTDTAAFGAWDGAQIGNYDIPLTEQAGSGFYVGSFPAAVTAPGRYAVEVRRRAGGVPALTDEAVGSGVLDWNGAAEVNLTALPTAGEVMAAVFARAVDGAVTFEQAIRGMFGESVGDLAIDTDTGEYVIRSADGTKERARGTIGSDGTRTITARDLS